ncbi:MAG: hypothetical protein BM556_05530 [Bacteriovorax sp. MedPE-SWde]|nr:MAG: hypothetical protein BM556_05530 [Bacteriovorax sp. MedPE-SWde]
MKRKWLLILLVGLMSCSKKVDEKVVENFVATVSKKQLEVKHKRAKSFEWLETSLGQKLDNFDSIRTGESSQAHVKFEEGGEIDIDQNSLVLILERKLREQNLALPKGRVDGVIEDSDKKTEILIKTPNGWVSAKNTKGRVKFNINVKKKETRVKSVSGNLKLTVKGQKKIIEEGKEAVLKIKEESSDYKEAPVEAEIVFEEAKPIEKVKPVIKSIFEIKTPKKLEFTTKANELIFNGLLEGSIEVFLNGEELVQTEGKFETTIALKPGLNIFTFQVIKGKKVNYHIYKVVKK